MNYTFPGEREEKESSPEKDGGLADVLDGSLLDCSV
jgi:hypothetical protein